MINKQLLTCLGISNKTNDGYQLPFFDYDNIDLERVLKELRTIQEKYLLSTIYLIKSDTGYNAFTLDKITYDILLKMYDDTKLVDKDYIKYCKKRGWFTLRLNYSKQLIHIIEPIHESLFYTKSNAHKLLFKNMINYNIIDNTNFDCLTELQLDIYSSTKHGVVIDGIL